MTEPNHPKISALWHLYGGGYYIDYSSTIFAVSVSEEGGVQFLEGIGVGRYHGTALGKEEVRRFKFNDEGNLVSIIYGKPDEEPVNHIIGIAENVRAAQAWIKDVNEIYRQIRITPAREQAAREKKVWVKHIYHTQGGN